MKLHYALALYISAIALAIGAIAVRKETPRRPREEYSLHVHHCQQCSRLDVPLCDDGERLRRAARDADGLLDSVLDGGGAALSHACR